MLGVQTSVVVGHSWGALVALSMALRDPASVTGLVLLSGYYYPTARLDVVIQTPASLPVIGQLVRYTLWPLAARLCAPAAFKFLFSPLKVPSAFRKAYSVPMATRPCQLKSFADDTVTMPTAAGHICSRYGEIDVPIRLIAGVNDKVVSTQEQSERLNRNLKDCELQLLEGVGHMSHHARPDLVVAAVDALSNADQHETPAALTPKQNCSDLICRSTKASSGWQRITPSAEQLRLFGNMTSAQVIPAVTLSRNGEPRACPLQNM